MYARKTFILQAYMLCWNRSIKKLKGKKPLRPGDNQFFIEDPNRISMSGYYRSWKLVILFIVIGFSLLSWAGEH